MATFLKEYPSMSVYYYWNVLTFEMRTLMLSDVTRVKYNKKGKDAESKLEEKKITMDEFLKG